MTVLTASTHVQQFDMWFRHPWSIGSGDSISCHGSHHQELWTGTQR